MSRGRHMHSDGIIRNGAELARARTRSARLALVDPSDLEGGSGVVVAKAGIGIAVEHVGELQQRKTEQEVASAPLDGEGARELSSPELDMGHVMVRANPDFANSTARLTRGNRSCGKVTIVVAMTILPERPNKPEHGAPTHHK